MHTSFKIGFGVDSDDGEWNDVIVEKFLPCGKICPGAQVLRMVGRGKRRKLRISNQFLLLLNYLEELLLCWHCANQGYCLGRRQSKHLKGRSKKASKETCQTDSVWMSVTLFWVKCLKARNMVPQGAGLRGRRPYLRTDVQQGRCGWMIYGWWSQQKSKKQ